MFGCSGSKFDELRWVTNIRRTLEEELKDDNESPVCIFNVPKTLMSSYPDSFTPQQLSLGPYRYWSSELHEMERYKLSAAKGMQKELQGLKFQDLVLQLIKLEPKIRACYHRYLNLNAETLAWMMALDASFLLEFLHIYTLKEPKMLSRVSSRMSHLLDYSKRKSAQNAILRDIMKLENQIPLFVLRKLLEFQFLLLESADDVLHSMLMGLCKEVSPFKIMESLPQTKVPETAHLLDFLYRVIVPKMEEGIEIIEEVEEFTEAKQENEESTNSDESSYAKQLLSLFWNLISKLNIGPVRFLNKVLRSKPVRVILKFPWKILSNLPGFAILNHVLGFLIFWQDEAQIQPESESCSFIKPPLVEEIAIPSVTQLSNSGVCFRPTNGGISTINFDMRTVTFYVPTVTLDVNTEVIMRNLVAYEASNESGPMVFTRYTEFMNGIIDTEADVKLLRKKGIVLNHLKSDEEAAKMWNGITKSIKLTKVPIIDKVIEDANKYYDSRLKVKIGRFIKQYVFGSWKFLTFLAAILLLLLTALQSFCSVYDCTRIFHIRY